MGAEGYLTLAKLEQPRALSLFCSTIPQFEVTEPVAIYSAAAMTYGSEGYSHTNLEMGYCPTVMHLAMCGHARLLRLRNEGEILVGLAIVSRAMLAEWQAESDWIDPGEVPIEEAREAWNKITPGIWMAKEYREHPATPERCMTYETPPHCRLGERVEWMLWT